MTPVNRLQFSYKGRTSTLGSPDDIAAWIEERKERFPTKAKAAARRAKIQEQTRIAKEHLKAETRRKQEERQKAKGEHQRKQDENRKKKEERKKLHEEKEKKAQAAKAKRKEEKSLNKDMDEAAKERLKIEKLRRALEKSEKRIARMEAKQETPSKDPRDSDSGTLLGVNDTGRLPSSNTQDLRDEHVATTMPGSNTADADHPGRPITPQSEPLSPEHKATPDEPALASSFLYKILDRNPDGSLNPLSTEIESPDNSDGSISITSSDLTSSGDESTSSSGSSSSPTASSDDESAPDEQTSVRHQTTKTARFANPRITSKSICRQFLRFGRCNRGRNCRYRHERPERGKEARKRKEAEQEDRPFAGMTLHQRLMARQTEEEVGKGDQGAPDGQKQRPQPELGSGETKKSELQMALIMDVSVEVPVQGPKEEPSEPTEVKSEDPAG